MAEKILVVEDERNIASFVAMYLKNARYQVDIARDGTEALQKADSTKPVFAFGRSSSIAAYARPVSAGGSSRMLMW